MVHPLARKFVPLLSFVIASSALGFQVFVLYPWHHQLEREFHDLQEEQREQLKNYHYLKMETIKNIESDLKKIKLVNDSPKSS